MEMAVCFKLIGIDERTAEYGYGLDDSNLKGRFKVDLSKTKGKDTVNDDDAHMELIVPCDGEADGYPLLGLAFVKLLRHYQEHGEYLEKGERDS